MGSITPAASAPVRSLRSRWTRAFAVLAVVVVVGAMANLTATHVLVGTFGDTAERVEHDATVLAALRTDVAAHTSLLHRFMDGDDPQRLGLEATQESVQNGFEHGIEDSHTASGRDSLGQASAQWQALTASAVPLEASIPVPERLARHQALATGIDEVEGLLGVAGDAGRTAVRADLARARDIEEVAFASMVGLGLLALALMLHLTRRLSAEILRPVGVLRDTANQLAAGRLDHRVEVGRNDEIGELAACFNAMADAIAGSQRILSRQANQDSLTGLANRAAFHARLQSTLSHPERRGGKQAVMFVDLDDFKDVNDTLGHAAGDELLCVVAARLLDTVRPGDLVARLGGDEFALLLDGCADAAVALNVAERAVAALAAPVEVSATWVSVGASVGLAFRRDDSDTDGLMREADVAMYMAKGRGKNRVECYDSALNDAVVEHHSLKAEIAGAAGRGELVIEYQPIVHLASGGITGVEALVRWQHPTRGLLPPSSFLSLAEETGAINGIGSWVLETAARQLVGWQRRYGLGRLSLAVNVSMGQLDEPGFVADVDDVLRRTGLGPDCLVLEVAEAVLADPSGAAAATLEGLRRLGARVAIDDFGTGYSSIGKLRVLPVDILKIDRSFVSGEHANFQGDVLIEAIVGLAQRLGIDVVPEGIEEPEQLARLRAMGCQTGQGFFMSRPVRAAAIDELLADRRPLLALGLEDGDRTVVA